MLRNIQDLEGYAIRATDGDVGLAKDFYFDDQAWVIRYLVVETGDWLASRKVLISPIAIGRPDDVAEALPVQITRQQVESSPDIDTHTPVSRQQEMYLLTHYGHSPWWESLAVWGAGTHPDSVMPEFSSTPMVIEPQPDEPPPIAELLPQQYEDPHLRALNDLVGYHIHASDGDIGHVSGMLVDEESWAVRYLVIDAGPWWHGHQVLMAPQWIEGVSWSDRTVSVTLPRQAVQDAPLYDPTVTLDRDAEEAIWSHYGRTGYWSEEPDRVRIATLR